MRFREGTVGQQALFFGLIGVYVLALALRLTHEARGMGEAHPGFHFIRDSTQNGWFLSGVGEAATDNGLLWGSELLSFNGVPVGDIERATEPGHYWGYPLPRELVNAEIGQSNRIEFRRGWRPQRSQVQIVDLPVTARTWKDVVCTSGTPFTLGAVFMVVGIVSFVLRPYGHASWALLTFCAFFAAFVSMIFRITYYDGLAALTLTAVSSLFVFSPLYLCMASVVPHPLLARHPRLPLLLSAPAFIIIGYSLFAAADQGAAIETALSGIMLIATLFTLTRALTLAVNGPTRIVRQRGRVVLIGCLGFVPPTVVWFAQMNFQTLMVDMRVVLTTVLSFPIAIAYTTVRNELFNARIAMRRSIVYSLVMLVGVTEAVVLTTVLTGVLGAASRTWVTPAVIAFVLLPLLHYWPRMNERLTDWLYPKRARFPELMQALGETMASCTSSEAILGVLARAPREVCDARSGVAFLFPEAGQDTGLLSACGDVALDAFPGLQDTPVIQLLTATRNPMSRDAIAVEPQYANIKGECRDTMDTLGAEVILPILRQNRVVGGLAVGPRTSGDVFDPAELNVLTMLTQQAVQAIMRTEAFDKLQARQQDIAHLKHYLQPHVVDEIIEKGTDAVLESRRKMVTVFFSDLRGFTPFSERVEPEEVMATLAEYHEAMGRRITQYGGTLERFAGDGLMAFFNDPVEQLDHVQRAVRMALDMREDVRQLRDNWVRKGYHLDVGMGIHTGYATCGVVGYEGRRDYAVIGNVTNMAARFCDAAAGGEVLVSARIISELGTAFSNEAVGELTLKGFQDPQLTYRVLGTETHV